MSTAVHPLRELPNEVLAQWLHNAKVEVQRPNELRQRLVAFLANKQNGNIFKNINAGAIGIVSAAKQGGLQAMFKNNAHMPLTLDELVMHGITANDLFSSNGLAVSLVELVNTKIITSFNDLVRLGVTLRDILGPYENPGRQARLNPTVLCTSLGDDVIKALKKPPFSLTPLNIIQEYAHYLLPSDFVALGMGLDTVLMQTKPELVDAMRQRYRTLFPKYPEEQWISEAKLTPEYLRLMGIDARIMLHWTAKSKK